ncbi:heme exporter protein CcmD [Fulvimonas soli]|jgi:heme exporter protein D|uniref:Heme exporter protein D n=1 Tax=Fulvimonas soli TaxID=155197 RepID=A0A316IJ29_9GAMM|nr:heme exporter protein CcmD [Fulvimonas soli]PWK92920.1 heme exporter protein D [Fulvimonas soli]TNY26598.1 heme exporter protein CcmD [Fulvimonas soli]
MNGFFAMGGYAAYVWPAYAVFLLVLAADFLSPALRRRRILRELRARLARQARRQRAPAPGSLPSER